jgi:hypothetical protein
MKKIKSITPMIGKKVFIFCCEESIYKKLETIADGWFVRPEVAVHALVKRFEPKFDDIVYFMKGGYKDTLIDRMINSIRKKESKLFIPMQLDEAIITKLGDAKRYYGMNKSSVLKHIINSYEI